jgi:hypothetical protein
VGGRKVKAFEYQKQKSSKSEEFVNSRRGVTTTFRSIVGEEIWPLKYHVQMLRRTHRGGSYLDC